MESLKCKIRISILWISFAVCASAAMIIWFIEPGILEQVMTMGRLVREDLTPLNILFFALWWLLPLSMAFLTQIFNSALNRWANILLSSICALITVLYIINNIISGWFRMANFLILMYMFVSMLLIMHYAWKLPKKDAKTGSDLGM